MCCVSDVVHAVVMPVVFMSSQASYGRALGGAANAAVELPL